MKIIYGYKNNYVCRMGETRDVQSMLPLNKLQLRFSETHSVKSLF